MILILFESARAVSLECNNGNVPFYYGAQAGVCSACRLQNSHCDWVTPKGIFNDNNKVKIQIRVDKVERVKTKQWELAASVSFFRPLQFSFLYSLCYIFTLLALHFSHSITGSPLSTFCMEVSGKGFARSIAHTTSFLCVLQRKIGESQNLHNDVLLDGWLVRQGKFSLSQRSSPDAVHHKCGNNYRLCMYFLCTHTVNYAN